MSKDMKYQDAPISINPAFEPLKSEGSILAKEIQESVIKVTQEAQEGDLNELLKKYRVVPGEKIKPPQIALKQITPDGPRILGTLGNISLITGKAKSRKSFLVTVAVSAALSDGLLLNQIRGSLPPDKSKVLYFDTEQSKYHVQLAVKRICKQIGRPEPSNLIVYGLRPEPPKVRRDLINFAIENTENIGLVIIDGIRDLVSSINDEGESTEIASWLLKLTEIHNIHIINVLHQNKGNDFARGHLGAELTNKSETVLSVTKWDKDKDVSIVEPEQCRNREPEPFAFEIQEGLPVLTHKYAQDPGRKSRKIDLTEIDEIQRGRLLDHAFRKDDKIGHGELARQIKLSAKKILSVKVGDNKIKDFITYCRNEGFLIQDKERKPYYLPEKKV